MVDLVEAVMQAARYTEQGFVFNPHSALKPSIIGINLVAFR